MTHTSKAGERRRARATILCAFLRARLRSEILYEALRYHHDGCSSQLGFGDCDCDGPERTREQLEAQLAVVNLVDEADVPCVTALAAVEAIGRTYSHHENYPQPLDSSRPSVDRAETVA